MTSNKIRKKFLDYFESKGHRIVPSSGLIPLGDPTLLFTNAGMVQFKAVLLDEEKRDYVRATSSQKCVRAGGKHNDLENVGRTARHHTFFEMLGNFSFGDYFKKDAIEYGWDFLTVEMGLDPDKLWVTVYKDDDTSAELWEKDIGVKPERIIRLGDKDNFWSMGDTGPCGPCSEIHFDQGESFGCKRSDCSIECDCGRYLEIWNLVFMQFNRDASGKLTPLPRPSIDTGMGLERLCAVMQGKETNYETDLFTPIIEFIKDISSTGPRASAEQEVSIKAIADHARAVTFLIADAVLPSNEGRGYVLRRILRRAVRRGKHLGLSEPFLYKVCDIVIGLMKGPYPELISARDLILRATKGEEERFLETLDRGLDLLDNEINSLEGKTTILSGESAFRLYDTYGFPLDLTADILQERGLSIDEDAFNASMEAQRTKARRAWKGSGEVGAHEHYKALNKDGLHCEFVGYTDETSSSVVVKIFKDGLSVNAVSAGESAEIIMDKTPFYAESGGQVGETGEIRKASSVVAIVTDTQKPLGEIIVHHADIKTGEIKINDTLDLRPDIDKRQATRRNHSATHILHAILRSRLGEHVRQAGSYVNPKGLRFDFNHFEALSPDELRAIEEEANRAVMTNKTVITDELPYEEALARGALAFFEEKYSDLVRMVQIDALSTELCGGTHVKMTGEIGFIKIISESSVAAGVRRIEALTGESALELIEDTDIMTKTLSATLRVNAGEIPARVTKILERQKELEREITRLKSRSNEGKIDDLLKNIQTINDIKLLTLRLKGEESEDLRLLADRLRAKIGSAIVVLGATTDGKAKLLVAVTKDLTKRFKAGDIIKEIAPVIGGRGGGRPDMAQAGGKDPSRIDEALNKVASIIEANS